MHYLALLRQTQPSGEAPAELLRAIGELGLEATRSGVLRDTAGVTPGVPATRVEFVDGKPVASDAPPHTLVGYALYDVESKDEAVDWTNRFLQLNHDLWPGWQGEAELVEVFRPN